MPNKDFQKELKEKVKEGVKPSDLKKLKKSKSADDISSSLTPNIPLKKSQSQLEIPLTQPSSKQQITQLKEQVQFHAETAKNYLQFLQTSQAKVSELEEKLKNNPPRPLLADQLKEKQREVEILRKNLEETQQKLERTTQELDQSLFARQQAVKQFGQIQEKLSALKLELRQTEDDATDEIIHQDKKISKLRSEKQQFKLKIGELERDLETVRRLAEMRKTPYHSANSDDYPFLRYTLYTLLAVGFTVWLRGSLGK